MGKRSFDLVIAGAGPAGSLAAYTAARAGLEVLLLEREAFPRPKPCGGLLSGKALASLPWPLPEEIWECPIRGVSLVNNRGEALYFRQEKAFAVTVRRELLDQFLLEKARGAGARFLDNTPLTDLSQREEDRTVVTPQGNFRALVVIGADGYQSRTARAAGLRRQWSPWERGTALVSRPFLPREEAARLTRGGDAATFFTLPLPASLGWLFPLDTGVSVGIGAPSLVGKQLFPLFQDFLALLNRTYGTSIPCRQPQIWHLPAGGFPRPLARGNVLLVGDAAGFVDPFSGEGIYWAVNSGITAANLAIAYLAGKLPGSLAQAYSRECRKKWQREFGLSLLLALLTGKKDLFFRILKHNPKAMALFPTIMEEPNCYRQLFLATLPHLPRLLARTLFP
ncbi:MAG: geranylgeranyl reductase family protein [bacterium]